MANPNRGIKKQTDPGSMDDDAIERAKKRAEMLRKAGAQNDSVNEYDAMNDALAEAHEPDSVRKLFES
jgi:ABC-type transporter lipoprotein component MlaA